MEETDIFASQDSIIRSSADTTNSLQDEISASTCDDDTTNSQQDELPIEPTCDDTPTDGPPKVVVKSTPVPLSETNFDENDVHKFNIKRRSSTMNSLGKENFRPDACQGKQGSFVTDRPFKWFQALKSFIENSNSKSRCEIKRTKDGKISIVKVRASHNTKEVIMFAINFTTGVFVVKCSSILDWISKQFPILKSNLEKLDGEHITPSPADIVTISDVHVEKSTPVKNGEQFILGEKEVSKNNSTDIQELWSCVDHLKNAIKTIEKSVCDLSEQTTKSIEKVKDQHIMQNNKIKELDQRLDDKISVFSDTLRDELKKQLVSQASSMNNKLFDIKKNHNNLKESIASLPPPPSVVTNNFELSERVTELEDLVKTFDIKELKQDLNKLSDDMNIDTVSISVLEKNVQNLKDEVSDRRQEILGLDKNLARFKKELKEETRYIREESKMQTNAVTTNLGMIQSIAASLEEHKRTKTNSTTPRTSNLISCHSSITGEDIEEAVLDANHQLHTDDDDGAAEKRNAGDSPSAETAVTDVTPAVDVRTPTIKDKLLEDDQTELIFIIDSNGRYLDYRKLWTMKGTEVRRCGDMIDVNQYWDNTGRFFTNLKYLFVSVGCNDLKKQTPHELFTSINKFVQRVWERYPDLKIILSEVYPRMDQVGADEKVKEANVLLSQYTQGFPNLFLTINSNLRKPGNYFQDGIHLQHHIIPLFATNIKRALRRAYGIKFDRNLHSKRNEGHQFRSDSKIHQQPPPQQHHQQQQQRSNQWEEPLMQLVRNEIIAQLSRSLPYVGT